MAIVTQAREVAAVVGPEFLGSQCAWQQQADVRIAVAKLFRRRSLRDEGIERLHVRHITFDRPEHGLPGRISAGVLSGIGATCGGGNDQRQHTHRDQGSANHDFASSSAIEHAI